MAVTSRRRGKDHRNLSLVRVVNAVKPEAVRYFVWDDSEAGFGLDVWPSGTRTWCLIYRVNGVQRRMTLGSADEVTPDAARKKARAAKLAADEGRDPLLERKASRTGAIAANKSRREAPTVADVAADYLATLAAKRSPRWAEDAKYLYDAVIAEKLGHIRVAELGVREVSKLHEGMADRPAYANRVKAVISGIVATAIRHGDRAESLGNPAHSVEAYDEAPRERVLTLEEWAALAEAWPKVRAEVTDASERDTSAAQLDALELLVLTGARYRAILPRRVGDLSPDGRTLAVVPTHKYVSRVLLGSAAVRTVARVTEGKGAGEYLFPGRANRTRRKDAERETLAPSSLATVRPTWNRLRELANLEDVQLRDLRACFATMGAELQFSDFVVGGLLGHTKQGVTERHYMARTDALLLEAADAISEEIAKRLGLPAMQGND